MFYICIAFLIVQLFINPLCYAETEKVKINPESGQEK